LKPTKRPNQLAKNASKLHRKVLELLTSCSLFNGYEIRQEYNVSRVNPSFKSNREKFDIVILGLQVIIEVHGRQHFSPVCFGGIDKEQALVNYLKQQDQDAAKQEAAESAGWAYLYVKYDEKDITIGKLQTRISEAIKKIKIQSSKDKLEDIKKKIPKKTSTVRQKAKIQQPKNHKWPTKKIPSRKFGS